MPTVPRLKENRIEERGVRFERQRTDAPEGAFGGGRSAAAVTRAGASLADATNKIALEAKQQADQIAIMDADRKLSELETRLLHDPESGAFTKRGKDAFTLPDTVMDQYQSGVDEINQELSNDFQKRSFHEISSKRGVFVDRSVQKHVSKEARDYDNMSTKSYIANEQNAAVQNYDDSERIGLSIQRQKGALIAHAERNGLPDETKKQMLEQAESSTHSGVMTKLMNGGADIQAKEYFKNNKDKMVADDRQKMEKLLKKSILMGDGQRNADKITSNTDSMSEALEKAREIKDPDLRDETVSRVKQRFAERRAAERDQEQQDYEVAFDVIEKQRSFDAIPKDVLDRLPATTQRKLKNHLADLQSGKPTRTDFNTYYKLELMAGNPATRDKFIQENLLKHKASLSDGDFKKMATLQSNMRKGSMEDADGIQSKGGIVNDALGAAGIQLGARASDDEKESARRFREEVDVRVIQHEKQTGQKIGTQELRKITNDLMIEVTTKDGWLWDTKKRLFELSPNDSPIVRFDDVPEVDRVKIGNALRAKGLPVTDEAITNIYVKRLNKISGRGGS